MAGSVRNGFLVVADITGYSAFLSSSELDHASDILKTLMDLLIDNTRAPLAVSGLEGDAVFSYSVDTDRFKAQAFVELIDHTYISFKRAIELMVMNTSCECNACANIGALDLKFFIHHGEFAVRTLGSSEELFGSDVNLIHRLLKNDIAEKTGVPAYTFLTQAAVDAIALDDFTEGLTPYEDTFADAGVVSGWVMDMAPIWDASKNESFIAPPRGAMTFIEDYPLPPEQLWGYITNPKYRQVFSNAKRQETSGRRRGRVGLGTIYECFHLDNSTSTNTVLEWHPFSRIVSLNTVRSSKIIATYELEPIDSGTQVTMKLGPLDGPFVDKVVGIPKFLLKGRKEARQGMANLRTLIEDDIGTGKVVGPPSATVSREARDAAIAASLSGNS